MQNHADLWEGGRLLEAPQYHYHALNDRPVPLKPLMGMRVPASACGRIHGSRKAFGYRRARRSLDFKPCPKSLTRRSFFEGSVLQRPAQP